MALTSALLVVWVVSLVGTVVVARTGPTVAAGVTLTTLGGVPVALSSVLTVAALFVLPAQYSWMYY